MARKARAPLRVNGESRPKSDHGSWVRELIDVARGSGPEGIVVLGAIFSIAHYGQTDWKFLLFSLLVIWSLLVFKFICRRYFGLKLRPQRVTSKRHKRERPD